MTAVLDAWAVIAYLQDEPAAARAVSAIKSREAVMSDVNLGEVLYIVSRGRGEVVAKGLIRDLRQQVRSEPPDWPLTTAAALVKAHGGVSYADAFAVATAQRHRAPLYTGDPEIVALGDLVDVVDLREHGR